MNFKFFPLDHLQYQHLFKLNDEELAEKNIIKQIVKKFPGTPCRVTLEDAEIGEEVLLFSYNHLDGQSPYNSTGAIFIRNKTTINYKPNEIPRMISCRLQSVRAYDSNKMMIFADVIEGNLLSEKIPEIFNDLKVEFIHMHNAKPGCFNALIKRI